MKFFSSGFSQQYLKQVHEESLYVATVQAQRERSVAEKTADRSPLPFPRPAPAAMPGRLQAG